MLSAILYTHTYIDLDTPTLFEKILSTRTIIIIGVVPVVGVIIIATVIGVVKCVYFYKKYNAKQYKHQNKFELKALVANNTKDILKELRSIMTNEKDLDIRKEALLTFKELSLAQINLLCKTSRVTLATQTSNLATSRSNSQQPSRQTSDATPGEDTDQVDGPAGGGQVSSISSHQGNGSEPPPSYEQLSPITHSEVDPEEKELTNLLATCISDIIVQATLVQDENGGLVGQVERKIKGAVAKRQLSTMAMHMGVETQV